MIPRAQWADHPNWQTQTLLLRSHEAFRKRSEWIIERVGAVAGDVAARRRRWLSRMSTDFDWWMAGMSGHERYEERKLYPFLARRYHTAFDELIEGHQLLHRHRDAVQDAFRRAMASDAQTSGNHSGLLDTLGEHRGVLLRHLHDEEDRVIPLLLELSPSEFAAFVGYG